MSDIKLDRTNLKRQAQRVESYSVLVSKSRRAIFKDDTMHTGTSRAERSQNLEHFNTDIKEYEEEKGKNYFNEECSSPSSSSDSSSQEFQRNLYKDCRSVQSNANQYEDACPVMTRSAARKYASVGAIYNNVDLEHELKITKNWPASVCSPPPDVPLDSIFIKDLVSRSLSFVMSFCKYATLTSQKEREKVVASVSKLIDLSPYLSEEPMPESGDHPTQITLHLDQSALYHHFINVISINNEEQSQALVVQENDSELETITLHSGETCVIDNKYKSHSNSVFVNLNGSKASKSMQSISSEDPMMAVYNDHTYAMRYSEHICDTKSQSNEALEMKQEKSELILQNALEDLLLNTTILKSLICGNTPQEMIAYLDKAHKNIEYF